MQKQQKDRTTFHGKGYLHHRPLLLDNNILIYLMTYKKTSSRQELRRIMESLMEYCQFPTCVLIPKSVKAEFTRVNLNKRESFLYLLSKEMNSIGLKFEICKIYSRHQINKIKEEYQIDLGEADAINQIIEINKKIHTSCVFLTNDKGVLALKEKIIHAQIMPWKDFISFMRERYNVQLPGNH